MKSSLLRYAALMGLLWGGTLTPSASAQVTINVTPPAWGPPAPAGSQYYYLSGVEGYYDLSSREYVLLDGGRWARARALPARYRGVALQPVVVDYVGPTPWVRLPVYRTKYPKGGNSHGLPPGQAKKRYGDQPGNGKGPGKSNGKGNGKHH